MVGPAAPAPHQWWPVPSPFPSFLPRTPFSCPRKAPEAVRVLMHHYPVPSTCPPQFCLPFFSSLGLPNHPTTQQPLTTPPSFPPIIMPMPCIHPPTPTTHPQRPNITMGMNDDLHVDEDLKGYLSDGPTDWVEPTYEPDYSTAIVVGTYIGTSSSSSSSSSCGWVGRKGVCVQQSRVLTLLCVCMHARHPPIPFLPPAFGAGPPGGRDCPLSPPPTHPLLPNKQTTCPRCPRTSTKSSWRSSRRFMTRWGSSRKGGCRCLLMRILGARWALPL